MLNETKEKDYAISIVRLIATTLIVLCHIERYFGHPLTQWLNVGVQIFLCMSGYLYGQKKFDGDDLAFYKKQFLKILLDYYIVIVSMITLCFICARDSLSLISVARTFFAYGPPFIPGGGIYGMYNFAWYAICLPLFCHVFLTKYLNIL